MEAEISKQKCLEIAERGRALYDKFVLFVESLKDIGQRIQQTQNSYNQAMNRLSVGHGNVIRQIGMLRELGVEATKNLTGELAKVQELEGEAGMASSTFSFAWWSRASS